ncbi:MAG: L,D-transpeptidase family protein [Bacillota bacterium]|nr:L,D-transpeptidase family protein [Bacillota bacterium]
MKKLIAFMVSVCMVITLIPTFAFAEDGVSDDVELTQEPSVEVQQFDENADDQLGADPADYGWKNENGHWLFYDGEGHPYTGFKSLDKGVYYFDESGYMLTDWQTINGNKYYFDRNGSDPSAGGDTLGVMASGWTDLDAARYYFNPTTGVMHTGWLKLSGKKYYLDPKTGVMKTGWQTINKKKYYFKKSGDKMGVAFTGLMTIDGSKYYFTSEGVMKTGLVKVSGNLYYFKSNGKGQGKGWFKVKKKKRYSFGNGKLATGIEKIGSTYYQFNTSTGVLIKTIGDATDKDVQSKSSNSSYLIAVVKSSHQTRIYKGKKGNWKRVYKWSCATGKSSTPTPSGEFKISKKAYYNQNTKKTCRWWYCSYFKGNGIYFQSVLYDGNTAPGKGKLVDGRLGVSISDGCVRLSLTNAKWIYTNIPNGTKVYVK